MRKVILLLGSALLVIIVISLGMRSQNPATPDDTPDNGEVIGTQNSSASSSFSITQTQSTPKRELSCADGWDDDGDRLTDCDDPDCAGSRECRCSVLSCGQAGTPGSTFSCAPEEGCICNDANGCVSCKQKNETCNTNADCCFGLALECNEVVLGSGGREKRCMPIERQICNIQCENGIWGTPKVCQPAIMPPGTQDCDSLVGACTVARNEDRNVRKCWKS